MSQAKGDKDFSYFFVVQFLVWVKEKGRTVQGLFEGQGVMRSRYFHEREKAAFATAARSIPPFHTMTPSPMVRWRTLDPDNAFSITPIKRPFVGAWQNEFGFRTIIERRDHEMDEQRPTDEGDMLPGFVRIVRDRTERKRVKEAGSERGRR